MYIKTHKKDRRKPFMIQTSSIANLRHMQQDEIWLIVRSIGKAASLLSRPDVRWVPDLSPSKNLFFAYLRWKKESIRLHFYT